MQISLCIKAQFDKCYCNSMDSILDSLITFQISKLLLVSVAEYIGLRQTLKTSLLVTGPIMFFVN